MSRTRKMTITFTDGIEKTYEFNNQVTREGELYIWTEYHGSAMHNRYDEHWFPLTAIRERTIQPE